MANTKKYVSLDKLSLYDEKIKKVITDGDAAVLASANAYANGLATNYEPAGAVNTAKKELQKNIDAAQSAADTAQAAADKAQGEVDALEILVGALPEGTTASTVVEYVNKKTEGIATDAALGELNSQVSVLQTTVQGIKDDYLKSSDKTELSDAIATEASRADTAEKANAAAIKAISDDYLKGADKTELQGSINDVAGDVADIVADYLKAADKTELEGKINDKVAQADYDAKMTEIDGDIDGLQTQINTIMNNPDAENAINSINEFTTWVSEHGTVAEGMRTDINKNKEDIAAMDTAYKAADTVINGRLDALEAIEHDAYVAADTALKNELTTEIGKKADTTALNSAVQALEGVDAGLSSRLDAVEGKLGNGEGNVASMIATAKQEAIESATATASADATSKANAAEAAAKGHADSLNTAMDARVAAVEAASATHALASDLTALTTRVGTAEGKVSTLETEMDAVEAKAAANETAIGTINTELAKKAAQADLEAVSGRVTAIETWHENFVEVSEAEINALFATTQA